MADTALIRGQVLDAAREHMLDLAIEGRDADGNLTPESSKQIQATADMLLDPQAVKSVVEAAGQR